MIFYMLLKVGNFFPKSMIIFTHKLHDVVLTNEISPGIMAILTIRIKCFIKAPLLLLKNPVNYDWNVLLCKPGADIIEQRNDVVIIGPRRRYPDD